MKMKKIKYLIIILSILIITTGCEDNTQKENTIQKETKVNAIESNGETVKTKKMSQLKCTRKGNAGTGIITSLNYRIYYTGDRINIIQSEEKVSTADASILDEYENAYRSIHKHYEGLEYYDTNVTRGDTTVSSEITINYDKIDIDKLLSIGKEDVIFEDKVPKLDKWLELGKKVGITCEEVGEE